MILMKFKLNCFFFDFVECFCISKVIIYNIIIIYVFVLYEVFFEGMMENNIFLFFKCKVLMLVSFGDFNCCCFVIDVIEVIQDVFGQDMIVQLQIYSFYKNRYIVKFVIGVVFNGVVVYVSKLYFGSILDVVIVKYSNMFVKLFLGDMILVDKGFTIYFIFFQGIYLNIFFFFKDKGQYILVEV